MIGKNIIFIVLNVRHAVKANLQNKIFNDVFLIYVKASIWTILF